MNKFSVDQEKSLAIIKDIISRLKENDVVIHEDMIYEDIHGDTNNTTNVKPERHKIKLIEICTSLSEDDDINSYDDEILDLISNNEYNITNKVEIHFGSEIEDTDSILLTAHFHESQYECDISYTSVTYNKLYGFWIVDNIDCNGYLTILDFSDYTSCCI